MSEILTHYRSGVNSENNHIHIIQWQLLDGTVAIFSLHAEKIFIFSRFYLQIQKVVVYLHYTGCLIHKEYYYYGERFNDK